MPQVGHSARGPRADRAEPDEPGPVGAPGADTGAGDPTERDGVRPAAHGPRPGRLRGAMSDAGMTTAEYAVGTVAACGFAGVLYKLLTSGTVVGLLTGIVKRALSMGV